MTVGTLTDHPCPDCGIGRLVLRRNREGQLFYGCNRYPKCRGSHGAHADGRMYGIPADAPTRALRREAHEAFDRLWRSSRLLDGIAPQGNRARKQHRRILRKARTRAYTWLANLLEIDRDDCNFGRFDAATCQRAIELCSGVRWRDVQAWRPARK